MNEEMQEHEPITASNQPIPAHQTDQSLLLTKGEKISQLHLDKRYRTLIEQ